MNLGATEGLARRGELYPSVILHGGDEQRRQAAALRLATILLCDAPPQARPCQQCRHCSRVRWPAAGDEGFHPDFRVLERDLKTATSVEATKSFLQLAQVAPFEARGQVFVIARAETLTGEAANTLLKTLEEPPTRSPRHFLLLSPSQLDLLPTVRSRSLPVFLGVGQVADPERVVAVAERFERHVAAYLQEGSTLELLAAAQELAAAGDWQDPRATEAWTLAAAAVKQSAAGLERGARGRLLALAEELLGGWRLRVRGIRAERILEGLVVEHLDDPSRPRGG